MNGHIQSSSKGKKGEKTVIEYVEYYVDELSGSDLSKAVARIFYKIDHGKAGVLP